MNEPQKPPDRPPPTEIGGVPVHKHDGITYVRLDQIPEPLRTEFVKWLRGSQMPVIPGLDDHDTAYSWDWDVFFGRRKSGKR